MGMRDSDSAWSPWRREISVVNVCHVFRPVVLTVLTAIPPHSFHYMMFYTLFASLSEKKRVRLCKLLYIELRKCPSKSTISLCCIICRFAVEVYWLTFTISQLLGAFAELR
jgi:hypothetical protein